MPNSDRSPAKSHSVPVRANRASRRPRPERKSATHRQGNKIFARLSPGRRYLDRRAMDSALLKHTESGNSTETHPPQEQTATATTPCGQCTHPARPLPVRLYAQTPTRPVLDSQTLDSPKLLFIVRHEDQMARFGLRRQQQVHRSDRSSFRFQRGPNLPVLGTGRVIEVQKEQEFQQRAPLALPVPPAATRVGCGGGLRGWLWRAEPGRGTC